ncbi:MAG TPA: hypothetical protein VIK86_01285 [Candidatus Paceibacterota bacterium]
METNEILENNKLIAKFMGWSFIKLPINPEYPDQQWLKGKLEGSKDYDSQRCVMIDSETFEKDVEECINNMWNDLCNINWGRCGQYNTKWDYLMPVIKKCREKDRSMSILEYNQYIMQSFSFLDITKTWEAVVEFIKWYNEHKS